MKRAKSSKNIDTAGFDVNEADDGPSVVVQGMEKLLKKKKKGKKGKKGGKKKKGTKKTKNSKFALEPESDEPEETPEEAAAREAAEEAAALAEAEEKGARCQTRFRLPSGSFAT